MFQSEAVVANYHAVFLVECAGCPLEVLFAQAGKGCNLLRRRFVAYGKFTFVGFEQLD